MRESIFLNVRYVSIMIIMTEKVVGPTLILLIISTYSYMTVFFQGNSFIWGFGWELFCDIRDDIPNE